MVANFFGFNGFILFAEDVDILGGVTVTLEAEVLSSVADVVPVASSGAMVSGVLLSNPVVRAIGAITPKSMGPLLCTIGGPISPTGPCRSTGGPCHRASRRCHEGCEGALSPPDEK